MPPRSRWFVIPLLLGVSSCASPPAGPAANTQQEPPVVSGDCHLACEFLGRGDDWSAKKEYDRAIEDYTEAIRLHPGFSRAFFSRGFARGLKKEHDEAIKDFTEAIRLDPKDSQSLVLRGLTWADKKQYDQAFKDLNEALRLDPKESTAFYARGDTWRAKGNHDQALKDLTEAIHLSPKFALAYYTRGKVWHEKKAYDKEIKDHEEAIRLDPKYAWPLYKLAWLKATCPIAKNRDGKKAVELAMKAGELTQWKDGYPLDALAAASAEAGEFARAIEHQKQALNCPEFEKECGEAARKRLKLYEEKMPYREEEMPK